MNCVNPNMYTVNVAFEHHYLLYVLITDFIIFTKRLTNKFEYT